MRTTRTYYGTPRPSNPSTVLYDDNDNDDTDESSDATPLTRPSAAPLDIADLVEKALVHKRAKMNKRIAAL
jgi:hypothetical protein